MSGLVACLNDPVILVQRNTLEFLLLGFPMHTNLVTKTDLIKLVTNGLNTILRRDMSLNRRLYSWLLGSEVSNQQKRLTPAMTTDSTEKSDKSYFDQYSKDVLIEAIKCTLKISLQYSPVDLKPYRIMVSLLDKGTAFFQLKHTDGDNEIFFVYFQLKSDRSFWIMLCATLSAQCRCPMATLR